MHTVFLIMAIHKTFTRYNHWKNADETEGSKNSANEARISRVLFYLGFEITRSSTFS